MVRFAPPSKPVTLAPATEQCQIKSELIHFIHDFVRIISVVAVFVGALLGLQFVLAEPGEEVIMIVLDRIIAWASS